MVEPLDFFTDVVIEDVLKHQREIATRKAQVIEKQIPNSPLPNLQITVNQEPSVEGQPNKIKEVVQTLPKDALWRSALMQNYVHGFLRQDRLIEPLSVGRLAVHMGITYDALEQYLNDVYPQRKRLLITDE